jgi:hypothetical protein
MFLVNSFLDVLEVLCSLDLFFGASHAECSWLNVVILMCLCRWCFVSLHGISVLNYCWSFLHVSDTQKQPQPEFRPPRLCSSWPISCSDHVYTGSSVAVVILSRMGIPVTISYTGICTFPTCFLFEERYKTTYIYCNLFGSWFSSILFPFYFIYLRLACFLISTATPLPFSWCGVLTVLPYHSCKHVVMHTYNDIFGSWCRWSHDLCPYYSAINLLFLSMCKE